VTRSDHVRDSYNEVWSGNSDDMKRVLIKEIESSLVAEQVMSKTSGVNSSFRKYSQLVVLEHFISGIKL